MSQTDTLRRRWEAVMMNNYGTPPVALASGDGAVVTDVDGRSYLDLLGGIAVNILGHRHPAIIDAVTLEDARQAAKRLWGQGLITVVVGREPQAAAQSAGAPGMSAPPKAN